MTTINWQSPPPPTANDRRVRLPDVMTRTGFKSHRSIYERMAKGIFPPAYKDGNQTFWWLSHLKLYDRSLPTVAVRPIETAPAAKPAKPAPAALTLATMCNSL